MFKILSKHHAFSQFFDTYCKQAYFFVFFPFGVYTQIPYTHTISKQLSNTTKHSYAIKPVPKSVHLLSRPIPYPYRYPYCKSMILLLYGITAIFVVKLLYLSDPLILCDQQLPPSQRQVEQMSVALLIAIGFNHPPSNRLKNKLYVACSSNRLKLNMFYSFGQLRRPIAHYVF